MDWTMIGQQVVLGLSNGMAYALFAVGLSLIWGVMGVLNMAHGEFFMLGGLAAWGIGTYLGTNYFATLVIVMLMAAGLAILSHQIVVRPLLDTPRLLLATMMSTFGLSMVIKNTTVIFFGTEVARRPVTPFQDMVISVGGLQLTGNRLAILIIGAVAIISLHFFLQRSMWGKRMRATAQSRIGASLYGIDYRKVYLLAFALAGALAALAGILLAPIWFAYAFAGEPMLLTAFIVVIVAGLGSVIGAIAIGLGIGLAEALFGYFVSLPYTPAFVFAIMIVVLLVRPSGLFGREG